MDSDQTAVCPSTLLYPKYLMKGQIMSDEICGDSIRDCGEYLRDRRLELREEEEKEMQEIEEKIAKLEDERQHAPMTDWVHLNADLKQAEIKKEFDIEAKFRERLARLEQPPGRSLDSGS
jgi:hypothetical protein